MSVHRRASRRDSRYRPPPSPVRRCKIYRDKIARLTRRVRGQTLWPSAAMADKMTITAVPIMTLKINGPSKKDKVTMAIG